MAVGKYRILALNGSLNQGVCNGYYANINAAVKYNCASAPYCVANEYICGNLGRFIGLPVPPCGVVYAKDMDEKNWFCSLDFNLTGESLPPVDPMECVRRMPDESAGLVIFDIFIANGDRHRRNLSMMCDGGKAAMNIFDHSHALLGARDGSGVARLNDLIDRLGISGGSETHGNRHCLLNYISEAGHLNKWIKRVEQLPDYVIEDLCRDGVELGISADESSAAQNFLKNRRCAIADIIRANQDEFRSVTLWSLL